MPQLETKDFPVPLDAFTRDRLRKFALATGKTEREIASELLTELLFDDEFYECAYRGVQTVQ